MSKNNNLPENPVLYALEKLIEMIEINENAIHLILEQLEKKFSLKYFEKLNELQKLRMEMLKIFLGGNKFDPGNEIGDDDGSIFPPGDFKP